MHIYDGTELQCYRLSDWNFSRSPTKYAPRAPSYTSLKEALTDIYTYIRHCLPLKERIKFYIAIIKPIFTYGGLIWSSTSKDNLRRVFKLQKRAARVILGTRIREERTVTLFNKLNWLAFDDELKLNTC